MPCLPLPAYGAGELATALPSRGVNNSPAMSPPRGFVSPRKAPRKSPDATALHDVTAFCAVRCAQAGPNPLRAPTAREASPVAGDMPAKTFHGMTRDLWGNMAVQPVVEHVQQPLGENIVHKEPASCRSGEFAQDGADVAVSRAPAGRRAHASPSNRVVLRQNFIGDMTDQVARGMSRGCAPAAGLQTTSRVCAHAPVRRMPGSGTTPTAATHAAAMATASFRGTSSSGAPPRRLSWRISSSLGRADRFSGRGLTSCIALLLLLWVHTVARAATATCPPGYACDSTGYKGCYQDCGTQTDGQTMDRVCDDLGVTIVQDVDVCISRCSEYTYMGLACPHSRTGSTGFECWCCNTLDLTSTGGSGKIPDADCVNYASSVGIEAEL